MNPSPSQEKPCFDDGEGGNRPGLRAVPASADLRGTSPPAVSSAGDVLRWTQCLGRDRPSLRTQGEILIGVLPGEGIGSEVVNGALHILDAVAGVSGLRVETREGGAIGRDAEQACGTTLPDEIVQFCEEVFAAGGSILNGPGGGRYVYELRKRIDLFFKISPLQVVNGVPGASCLREEALHDVDILVTRENSGGVYQGVWTSRPDHGEGCVARHCFEYSQPQVLRFLKASARLAQSRRGRLAVVWKESGVPSISALWRDCTAQAAEACGVEWTMVDVDLMAYQLIQEASAFDVIAAPNLFGDVLADLGAVLMGSRGVSYSGNFTESGNAVYQTNHGAAYHLAGTDQANPAGQILSLVMMLRESFGLPREADAIEEALRSVWRAGWRTVDVAGRETQLVGTREFAALVADRAVAMVEERRSPEPEAG